MNFTTLRRKLCGHKTALFFTGACLIAIVALGVAWSYTSAPTSAARYMWERYRAGTLAVMLDRTDADLAMFIGNYYFNGVIGGGAYDPDAAQQAYAKAVSINSKILWGHYELARIHFVKGDFENALREVDAELGANPSNLRSLYIRGLIYGYRNGPGDLKRAEEDFQLFTSWAPKEWGGYNDLAWILSLEGKNQKAEGVIFSAFRNVPQGEENTWLWNALGVAELALGEYQKAAGSFEKAKTLASRLGPGDWRRAYPGNDPRGDESGLADFKKAIGENLSRATVHNAR